MGMDIDDTGNHPVIPHVENVAFRLAGLLHGDNPLNTAPRYLHISVDASRLGIDPRTLDDHPARPFPLMTGTAGMLC